MFPASRLTQYLVIDMIENYVILYLIRGVECDLDL